jgi:hypothetical protein
MGTAAKISDSDLTVREEQFAVAIIANGGKRREAYVEVYGNTNNPALAGAKIATKPLVAARIRQLLDDDLEIRKTTARRVIAETARIAFANPLDIFDRQVYRDEGKLVLIDLDDIPPGLAAAVKKIKSHAKGIEVEFHDKTRVLQDMQRRYGLLGGRSDAESQRVSVNINLGSDAPIKLTAAVVEAAPARQVVDVTPASPADEAPRPDEPGSAAEEIQPDLEF